ncbi:MAG: Asp23/Gls24 family envelope stress response protein [Chloroflexi bacterium]|nr:Asp23/Gls24 family envelope stress response protein [Chloroflexota bacterium]
MESIGATTGQTPPAPSAENLGRVEVSPNAVATIAASALENCYGVVGLAARRLRNGRAEMLRPEHAREGIQVHMEGEKIIIDLYVILEHNLRISEVAHNVMNTVQYQVQHSLGMPVEQVNVNVQGLRLSEDDGKDVKGLR